MRFVQQLGPVLTAVVFLWPTQAQVPDLAEAPNESSVVSIRVMFGLDRFTPQRWDGAIRVTPGSVLDLGGVHFEGRDRIVGSNQWLLTNRVTRYADSTTQRGYDPVHTRQFAMVPNGIAGSLDAEAASRVEVSTKQGTFSFPLRELKFGRPLGFLDERASVERIPATLDLTGGATNNDYPSLAAAGGESVYVSWISYENERDAVWLARHDGQTWGKPVQVTPSDHSDNFRTAVAIGNSGLPTVIWSGKSADGTWGLFSRTVSKDGPGPVASIAAEGPNMYLQASSDSEGNVHVAWQAFRDGVSVVLHSQWDGSSWSAETPVSGKASDSWAPAVATDSKGGVWVGWDGYRTGDFNVFVRRLRPDGSWDAARQITESAGFDANVSLACDADDRLWIAWDHGEANWGKDWSSQRFRPGGGAGLYRKRSVRVAALEGDRLWQTPDIMAAIPDAYKDYVQQARLAVDERGSVWAMARSLTSVTSRVNNNWGAGGIWEILLTRLDESGWLPAARLHATSGRNDVWATSARDSGGRLWFAWSRDARPFGSAGRPRNRPTPAAGTTHVSYAVLDPKDPAWRGLGQPALSEFEESLEQAVPVHPNETADTAAIREYRYEAGGNSYRILRGDLHRHTDISSDGIGEGALIDFYRYAITAGQYDFMLVADHQYGGDNVPGVEYNWWRTEKSEDIFHVPDRFWPLYGTERSIPYPNGHRNTVFATRGVRWMPIQAGERSGSINTGDILFAYLRRHGGISTPHTTGSDQGTDWRDIDPEVEPVVEIYQSLHASYEYPGAPRAETVDRRYFHHGEAWRSAGFVHQAWAKGIKIGLQASSDHVGTHDSYACVLVPAERSPTRQDLIDAMKQRRTYAATDNIILDMRIEDHLMGDAFSTLEQPVVQAKVIGTAPLARVVLFKNNTIVYSVTPEGSTAEFQYRDDAAVAGESYYYIRAEQSDGSLAWGSPIWVAYK